MLVHDQEEGVDRARGSARGVRLLVVPVRHRCRHIGRGCPPRQQRYRAHRRVQASAAGGAPALDAQAPRVRRRARVHLGGRLHNRAGVAWGGGGRAVPLRHPHVRAGQGQRERRHWVAPPSTMPALLSLVGTTAVAALDLPDGMMPVVAVEVEVEVEVAKPT
jgi:hypothetical protein